MNKQKLIKRVREYPNPYPPDIFVWDNKRNKKISVGRFNSFVFMVIENMREDIIKLIDEYEDD